ncbi:VCBS repeat-containing protein [Cohnella sp. LGH]|uniref:FG-GAP-like repeat-containing protein n=1 Tax=Cohnella sp. LGH TaxID=1619153 RepID=UPI001ADBED10|nr:FG-GAP-like repeat-containing protein [Cohnella sp. LGH]QTH41091.1 VCBS repeat-containing protein [Cohnella sp. LGH]
MGIKLRGFRRLAVISLVAVIAAGMLGDVRASAADVPPQLGIWYSTWYAKEGAYVWAENLGTASTNQLLGDANGDGKADAVLYDSSNGKWTVALSNGNGFSAASMWVTGHGYGSADQFLADVNGDGKADAVVYFEQDGSWWVSLSTGSGFGSYSKWKQSFGIGANKRMLSDVNGDGKADAIAYYGNAGDWWVAPSTGNAFGAESRWISGHGVGSGNQMLADVNGDGKADSIVFFDQDGSWWTALSNGANAFQGYTRWKNGFGSGSSAQFVGDTDGDGKADAVVYKSDSNPNGNWYRALSSGASFGSAQDWKIRHGNGSGKQWLADVFGDGMEAPVAFFPASGQWKALPADLYYFKPNLWNTWEGGLLPNSRPIKYVPRTNGVFSTYDSGDPAVIDEHLAMLADAKIDFVILDETNGINVDNGYIKQRAAALAGRIAIWNANPSHRPIKYAIAVGAMQSTHLPQTMEDESEIVWDEFANHPIYGGSDNYYYLNGKPLIVSYAEYADRLQWEGWSGDKTESNRFTVRWIQGKVPWEPGSVFGGTPPVSDYGLYFGWSYPLGAQANADTMVVMPGHNNNVGDWISRTYNGVRGGFYTELGWNRVLIQDPKIVVINSFNEFAEETAVQPADTSMLEAPSEKWLNGAGQQDPDMYWNMTKQAIEDLLAQ